MTERTPSQKMKDRLIREIRARQTKWTLERLTMGQGWVADLNSLAEADRLDVGEALALRLIELGWDDQIAGSK